MSADGGDLPAVGSRPMTWRRAPAKVNLTLHVLARRADGWHDLDSLVAFAGCGDWLGFEPGPRLALAVAGWSADAAGPVEDNLVLRAARRLMAQVPALTVGRFHLVKRLPVAAGLGGGSSDAAAALRMLAAVNGLAESDERLWTAARETGADVPVCLVPRARRMSGRGERLGPTTRLPPLFAVLVNPGVTVATPAVFSGLGLPPGRATGRAASPSYDELCAAPDPLVALGLARNDLEASARAFAPPIGEALAALAAAPGARVVRMSGSGATCFALFAERGAAAHAARWIAVTRPAWWVRPTVLR